MPKNENIVPLDMHSSWVVEKNNQDNYVFSVEVSHYKEIDLILGRKTGLYFNSLKGPSNSLECYIVHYDPNTKEVLPYDGNEILLEAYDYVEGEDPPTYTLYFASITEGSLDNNDNFDANSLSKGSRYQISLGIFDDKEIYAQSFPLIAIEVEEK